MLSLAHALERALSALESEDAVLASAALAEAERVCAQAERQGLRLDPETLERLRELHRRGMSAAERAAAKLAHALDSAGSARRAVSAYRR